MSLFIYDLHSLVHLRNHSYFLEISPPSSINRDRNPIHFDHGCNVLTKAFINKVGCPIDIYFTTQDINRGDEVEHNEGVHSDHNCEIFTQHLGSLEPFLALDPTMRDLDDNWMSPFGLQATYNGHSFVARMSHDQSLVARIDLDHDVVTDCPGPKRFIALADASESTFQGEPIEVPVVAFINATNYVRNPDVIIQSVDFKVDSATAVRLSLEGDASQDEQKRCDGPWRSRVGIISASGAIAA